MHLLKCLFELFHISIAVLVSFDEASPAARCNFLMGLPVIILYVSFKAGDIVLNVFMFPKTRQAYSSAEKHKTCAVYYMLFGNYQ